MNKIIRRTITITLTEIWTFVWNGMDDAGHSTDDVPSNYSIHQQLLSEVGGEAMQQATETNRDPAETPQPQAPTLSPARSRRRRKSTSKLPKTDS